MPTPEQIQALASLFLNQNAPPNNLPVLATPGQQQAQTQQDEAQRLIQQMTQPVAPEMLPVAPAQSAPWLRHMGSALADALTAYASVRGNAPGIATDFVGQLRARREQRDAALAENQRRMQASQIEGQRSAAGLQYQRLLGKEEADTRATERGQDEKLRRDLAALEAETGLTRSREETSSREILEREMERGRMARAKLDAETTLRATGMREKTEEAKDERTRQTDAVVAANQAILDLKKRLRDPKLRETIDITGEIEGVLDDLEAMGVSAERREQVLAFIQDKVLPLAEEEETRRSTVKTEGEKRKKERRIAAENDPLRNQAAYGPGNPGMRR